MLGLLVYSMRETPMPDPRIIAAMEAHRGEVVPPQLWFQFTADLLEPVIREMQAEAWDEGKSVGELDPLEAPPGYGKKPSNPYRRDTP